MLNQSEIEAFKNAGYSFEEIKKIQEASEDIKNGRVYTSEQVDEYINNTLFAKYKTRCTA